MGQYLAIVLLLGLGILFAVGSFVTNRMLVKGRPTAAKVAPYECGIVPAKEPPERFGVGFYLVAMLFIFFEVIAFSVVFFAAFVYVVARGGLDWGPVRRLRRLTPAVSAERTTSSTIRRVGLEGRNEPSEAA
jgi:NADH-quinone oxidoreductase subunit A